MKENSCQTETLKFKCYRRHFQNLFLYRCLMQFLPCQYLSNHDTLLGRPTPPNV